MVYIQPNTQGRATLRLPRTLFAASLTGVKLSLLHTIERRTYPVQIDTLSEDGDYYLIAGDFSGIKTSGEYDYRLALGDAVLASGVAVLGQLPEAVPEQYEHEVNFEQYD